VDAVEDAGGGEGCDPRCDDGEGGDGGGEGAGGGGEAGYGAADGEEDVGGARVQLWER
jgi:hypothetical protein